MLNTKRSGVRSAHSDAFVTDGIAAAISQYVNERDAELRRQMSEHLGFIAHEVRNPLSSARMALGLLQRKELAGGGRVVDLLARTLKRTGDVIDNALNHANLYVGDTYIESSTFVPASRAGSRVIQMGARLTF